MSLRARVERLARTTSPGGRCWRCGGEHTVDGKLTLEAVRRALAGEPWPVCRCPCCAEAAAELAAGLAAALGMADA